MSTYTVVIPDANEHGVTSAREAYNASLPADSPDVKADNAAYVQWVMEMASESYCMQYPVVQQ